MYNQRSIVTGSRRHPGRAVERDRQDEPVVVVGVLSDQIHTARCPVAARGPAEARCEVSGEVGRIDHLDCAGLAEPVAIRSSKSSWRLAGTSLPRKPPPD